MKASNPIEVAEYAAANRIVEEPAFKWWVPYVLQKRQSDHSKGKDEVLAHYAQVRHQATALSG